MNMRLIVAEKDSVARGVAKILSEGAVRRIRVLGLPAYRFTRGGVDHVAIGLRGHLFDFDFPGQLNRWDLETAGKLFDAQPILVIRDESARYVAALRRLAPRAEMAYLALDADSEGEAIAYEAAIVLRLSNPRIRLVRVRFNAVTKRDVLTAFSNPSQIDVKTVEKVFTRMMLDLTIGAAFTRALTSSVRAYARLSDGKFLSYGPCQTPVLALVVDREDARRNFKPEKYYVVRARAEVGGSVIEVRADKVFRSREEAESIVARILRGGGRVVRAAYDRRSVRPPEPLETVELERRMSRWFHIKSKVTLLIAEELYRRGYISYPRTETTIYPPSLDLRGILRELLNTQYRGYVERLLAQPRLTPTRGDSDDGAHPPIHPVKGATREEIVEEFGRVGRVAWLVYDFVVRHFLATLSPPAIIERQNIAIVVNGVELVSEGVRIVDEGYWRIYPFEKVAEKPLPRVSVGEPARIVRAWVEERETEPPPPMTEHELLALMKRFGIGTDSTMQDHIHTNVERGYMVIRKSICTPTRLGTELVHTLRSIAPMLVDHTLRAEMERMLQMIQRGEARPDDVLGRARSIFREAFSAVTGQWRAIGQALAKAINSGSGLGRSRRSTGT